MISSSRMTGRGRGGGGGGGSGSSIVRSIVRAMMMLQQVGSYDEDDGGDAAFAHLPRAPRNSIQYNLSSIQYYLSSIQYYLYLINPILSLINPILSLINPILSLINPILSLINPILSRLSTRTRPLVTYLSLPTIPALCSHSPNLIQHREALQLCLDSRRLYPRLVSTNSSTRALAPSMIIKTVVPSANVSSLDHRTRTRTSRHR